MPATLSPLPDAATAIVIPALQASVDALTMLYASAKLAHWNIRGPLRMPLHALFGSLASAVDEHTDAIAERLMQLGGVVAPSPCDAPATKDLDGLAICKALAPAIGEALSVLYDARDVTNDNSDLDSLDILTQATRAVEKIGADVLAHVT